MNPLARTLASTALAGWIIASACAPAQAPDVEAMRVPVVDEQGNQVGYADPSELERGLESGEAVEVYDDDGDRVGVFESGENGGFVPDE